MTEPHILRTPRRAAALLVCALALFAQGLVAPETSAADDAGLSVVAEIPDPWSAPFSQANLVAVDGERRRLYTAVRTQAGDNRLGEYDVSGRIPKPLRLSADSVPPGQFSPNTVSLASKQGFLAILADNGYTPLLETFDLKTLKRRSSWDLRTKAPGFTPFGMTYDAAAKRFYLIGEFSGAQVVTTMIAAFGRPVAPGPAVVALDAATGSPVWLHSLPECNQVVAQYNLGGTIALSATRPALYVFCDGGTIYRAPFGQAAAIRITFDRDATLSSAGSFRREVFPVSGLYYGGNTTSTGVVGFDAATERLFVQSLSAETPGGWVFDGLRSAWVGFVAAPSSYTFFMGINPANGRYYMGGGVVGAPGEPNPTAFLNVTDGRATPIAQGTITDAVWPQSYLLPDPKSSRVFARIAKTQGDPPVGAADGRQHLAVIEDRTPPMTPLEAVDYDALTKDIPDKDAHVSYSAGVEGFGARYLLIGGWEGIAERGNIALRPPNAGNVAFGDRGILLAPVPRVDLRQGGASATAAAAATDNATESDRTDRIRQVGGDPSTTLAFPHKVQTCLDGVGKKVETEEKNNTGRAHVLCDLAGETADATSTFADGSSAGGVRVASASFDARTLRRAGKGSATESVAVARGVSLPTPDGGSVSIGRVTVRATTVANGLPGSSTARWERSVKGVVVDPKDGAPTRLGGCDTVVEAGKPVSDAGDCAVLAGHINSAVPKQLEVRFPVPEVTATRRGAFAAIEEQESSYLNSLTLNNDQSRAVPGMQVEVRSDTQEKSRLFVELAATRASSIFTRSQRPMFEGFSDRLPGSTSAGANGGATGAGGRDGADGGTAGTPGSPGRWVPGQPGSPAGSADLGGIAGGDSPLGPSVALGEGGLAGAPGGVMGQPVMGWMIGARGPRDAALAAGIWVLFAGALAGVWRRRRLIEMVGE